MNERTIPTDRIWGERLNPTVEKERYKIEWRHRWEPDDTTMIVSQYYKLSDSEILKDYFEPEYERDQDPSSYVVATKGLTHGTLTARADYRVNRFTSTVDRLPEVGYVLPNLELFDSNFYWKNSTTYSSLWQKNASPTDTYAKTKRVDTTNAVSYPTKVSFIEVRPFVEARETYYSRTKELMQQDLVRGVFRTGADLSTKFYRIYEVQTNMLDLDINQLRHVITPSVAYQYQTDPTVRANKLDQYDSIDALARLHRATLSLENKLQTKRDEENVDLLRAIISSDFAFTQDALLSSSYNDVTLDLESEPYKWLGLYFDMRYDPQSDDFEAANFDIYINDPSSLWYLRLGERYYYKVDNQLETEVGWTINPKWKVRVCQIFNIDLGKNERQELLLIFSLKGFEDVKFEGGRTYGGGSERPGAAH